MKDWVPCFGYGIRGAVELFGGGTQFVISLVGTGLGIDPAGNQVGFPDTDPEEVTIHRTVGQIEWEALGTGEPPDIRLQMRFTTAMYNNTLGGLFPFTLDLDSGADANEGFFHERRMRLGLDHSYNTESGVDPNWSHFDLRSKRKLQSGEWTCMVVDANVTNAVPAFLAIRHHLRSWVTTK